MFVRSEVKETLQSNVATVTFTKANGEERVMKCTLKEEFLPPRNEDGAEERLVNLDVLPVWDIEAEGWRSFRIDSIKNVEISA